MNKPNEEPSVCPLCNKALAWKQLNLTEAVEICIDLKCPFPANSACRVRRRAVKNIQKTPKAPVCKIESSLEELLDAQQFGDVSVDDNFINDLDAFLSGVNDNI